MMTSLSADVASDGDSKVKVRRMFPASMLIFFVVLPGMAAQMQPATDPSGATATLLLAPGTRVELAVTAPVWARTAKPGDPIYAQTTFPVTQGSGIAIPAGTYVQGIIEQITRPTRKVSRAQLQVLFTKIIFANGYTVVLTDLTGTRGVASLPGGAAKDTAPAATAADITIQVSIQNDLLLDNGAQFEITLAAPLPLDSNQVASALPLTRPLQPGKFKSATECRPAPGSPGTPGTSDTVVPGSPGTPSTTIPGGPGMPDITIPGTPATPDIVIPGMPGTPGTPGTICPQAPMVISSIPMTTSSAQSEVVAAHL
jgi:hypothetical protein